MTKVYRLTLSNQREPQDYGLFSTEKKAYDYLVKSLRVQVQLESRYPQVTMLRSYDGLDFRITEEGVS